MRMRRAYELGVVGVSGLAILVLASLPLRPERSELVSNWATFGYHPDESQVSMGEEADAMANLKAATGTQLVTPDQVQKEYMRWIKPYLQAKQKQSKTLWGEKHIPSAVDLDGRPIDLRTDYDPPKIPGVFYKAAWGAKVDQQRFKDHGYAGKQVTTFPGVKKGLQPEDEEKKGRLTSLVQEINDPPDQEVDVFNPVEPWDGLPQEKKLDFTYADMQRDCMAQKRENGGKYDNVMWDSEVHECLKDGKPLTMFLEQPAEQRDTSTDFITVDLERDCNAMAVKQKGYAWDQEKKECRFWGEPIERKPPAVKRQLDFLETDLKNDCEQRGKAFKWVRGDYDGQPGACFKFGSRLKQPVEGPKFQALDFQTMDMILECKRRKWHWDHGRCTKYAKEGEVDQHGWRKPKQVLEWHPRPQKPDMFNPTAPEPSEGASTPATVTAKEGQPFESTDFVNECKKQKGVVKFLNDPYRVVCLSKYTCSVVDQYGWVDHDCARAGWENLWGTKRLGLRRPLPVDHFNPGGAEPSESETPPTSIDSSVWQVQLGQPHPQPQQNTELQGKDLANFVQGKPDGSSWTEGDNTANGKSKYYYNHATNELVWEGPKSRPGLCTEDVNGNGQVPGCSWAKGVDIATGEEYWRNTETGKKSWKNPFGEQQIPPQLEMTHRKGTWSGTRGGNAYWGPAYAQARLGPGVKVFNPFVHRVPNCGGRTGDCMGYAEGSGPAQDPDYFNPGAADAGPTRGFYGKEWDEKTAATPAKDKKPVSGKQKWYSEAEFRRNVPAALESSKARQQQLAEIYGVRITDEAAHKFFNVDYEKQLKKKPSHASTMKYVQYLAHHPTKGGGGGGDASPDEFKWPEKPKFGRHHKPVGRKQWCQWSGSGGQEVGCEIGTGGAWNADPVSEGIWGKSEHNKETMVGNKAWQIPKEAWPKQSD